MKDIKLNFGVIKETVSRLSAQEILKEKQSNLLKEFTKKINKNPLFLKQHLIYKNLSEKGKFLNKPHQVHLAERYIKQNLSILKDLKWKDIVNENRKLRFDLLEDSHVESTNSLRNELYNHINTLIEAATTTNYLKINEEQESYDYVLNYLLSEEKKQIQQETTENPSFKSWKIITEFAVNNFNKRYNHLNENDKKIFKFLVDTDLNKQNYIKDLKEENLKIINNLLIKEEDIKNIKLLENFKHQLNQPQTSKIDDTLIEYYNLNKTLKEI